MLLPNGRYAVGLLGSAAILVGAGCAPAPERVSQVTDAPQGPAGKAVVALSPQTTATVDPQLQGGASDFVNIEALYNRLLETPEDSLKLGPGLATKWTVSPDGKTLEFQIRKGVRFHNGDELTPEDVVFSMERVTKLALPSTKVYFERFLDQVEARGDSVVFRLKEPDWTAVNEVSGAAYSVVPKRYIEQVGDDAFLKAPVGTGPFKFVDWAKQEFLELQAVDYEHFLRQPGVQRLRYVVVPEETTRLAMVRTGEADLAQISVTSLKALQGDTQTRAIRVPDVGGLRLFLFGQEDPQNPLSKLEVRQALSLAIDRQAIAKGVYQGYARPVGTAIWNPAQPGFPEWGNTPPPYDLERAKELLAKAGYPGGKGLRFTFHNWEYGPMPMWTQVAPVIARQWERLGIQVELRQWEWGSWAPVARTGKVDPVSVGTHIANGAGEKGNITDFRRTGLYSHPAGTARGAHPELADMAEQFDRELDAAKRDQLREKIQVYDRDNVVYVPVFVQDALWAAGARLLDYTPRPGTITSGNVWTIRVRP